MKTEAEKPMAAFSEPEIRREHFWKDTQERTSSHCLWGGARGRYGITYPMQKWSIKNYLTRQKNAYHSVPAILAGDGLAWGGLGRRSCNFSGVTRQIWWQKWASSPQHPSVCCPRSRFPAIDKSQSFPMALPGAAWPWADTGSTMCFPN